MKKLNRKGYMAIEIILASVMTFVIAYFLIDLTMKLVNVTNDTYTDIILTTDKALITKNIKENIEDDAHYRCGIDSVTCNDNVCTIVYNEELTRKLSVIENTVNYSDEEGNVIYSKKINNGLSDITLTGTNVVDDVSYDYYIFKISGTNIFIDKNYDINIIVHNKICI